MGQKLYKSEDGGIIVVDRRKREGFTQMFNYIYDLWMPLIGIRGVGAYGVYCRLAMKGMVKGVSQQEFAKAMRISPSTLKNVDDQLEKCGFIKVTKPEGYKRSMHWTTCIEVFDPPKKISKELIEEYEHPRGYETLTPWLFDDDKIPENDVESSPHNHIVTDQKPYSYDIDELFSNANIEDSNIEDLDIEDLEKECAKAREVFQEPNKDGDQPSLEQIDERFKIAKNLRDKIDKKLPIDWVVAQSLNVTSDKGMAEREKRRKERIDNAKKVEREHFIANMRDWVAPMYIDMAIAFFKATGLKPVGESERKAWIKAFDRMYKKGIQPKDIVLGVQRMKETGMVIKSPFSIEAMAGEMREIRERHDRQQTVS